MKKCKRLIVSLLTLVACVCFCGGCALLDYFNFGKTEVENEERAKTVVLADFETWETGLQLIRTHANFGKITWNKDKAYVKEGIGSAKLQPLGGYDLGTMAQFFYPTYSEQYDINNKDFSDAKSVTFEFYNSEEEDLKVAVGLVTTILGPTSWKNSSIEYQTLPAKQWTTISYEVNASLLSMLTDIKDIQGVYVVFENQGSRELADAPVVYLDNIVLHRYETAPEIVDLVELGENEYMDFESPEWQNYVVSVKDTADAPTISIVESATEELLADTDPDGVHLSGKNVLKIVSPISSAGVWPGIQFATALLRESLFNGLSEKMYGATTFKFDIYNSSGAELALNIRFQDANEDYSVNFVSRVPAYSWYTAEYNVKQMYEDYTAKNKKKDLFTSPGMVDIRWGVKEETVFYIDNMRFEQEEIDANAVPTIKVSPFVREARVGSRISLPSAEVVDMYDLKPSVAMKVFYQDGTEWQEVALESGKIPVNQAGKYKIEVSSKNSLGNTATVDCYFEGLETAQTNLLASYRYADETDTIKIGTRSDTNKVTHLDEITLGGETRHGVMKVETDNKNGSWGAGFIGFAFAEDYLAQATAGNWSYITVRMYIETAISVPTVKMFSSAANLTPETGLSTGKWIEFTITKDILNNGAKSSYINQTGKVMSNSAFYSKANEIFGMYNSTYLFYIALNTEYGAGALKNNPKITYYIDEITWKGDGSGDFAGDVYTEDCYNDVWIDPNSKKKEEL